ncbi:MAG: Lrp/AsnC family transcriptional regulator [Acidimicrobiia bacterium]|nr:Lrp/AsnC family transcriptional regulator [Acidimicrobiia bacterium]NNC76027.1 Lrp/AsnC family transcriptional regulator [Acidimicrobiia bacterium]
MRSLDRTDREIIRLLQENARRSNKELAAAIGLAPSTCSERVRRLEDAGVFRGFHADVDPAVLGISLRAMVAVRLSRHTAHDVDQFTDRARAMPEVARMWHVSGANDFLIEVVVRDADHLRQLAVSGFTTMPEVAHIETALVFTESGTPTLPDLTRADAR